MESNESTGVRAAVRLTQLRRRIERWRLRRATRSPLRAQLWAAATELARELGLLSGRPRAESGVRLFP